MTWEFTVMSVVHILDSSTENLLAESIKLTLGLGNVVFNSIAILIDDISLNLGELDFLIVLVFARVLDSYHSDIRVRVDKRLAETRFFIGNLKGRRYRE